MLMSISLAFSITYMEGDDFMNTNRSRKQGGSLLLASNPAAQEIAKSAAIGTGDTPPETTQPVKTGADAAARTQTIAFAAYLRAERRGFTPGGELDDWLQAEAELDTLQAK